MNPSVLLMGNMAQDHLHLGRAIHQFYPDWKVDVLINEREYHFGSLKWEMNEKPSWVIDEDFNIISGIPYLLSLAKNYDIVQTISPYPMYGQFRIKRHIIYEAGWMKKFPFKDDYACKLARRAYARCKMIVMTNPDFYDIFNELDYLKNKPNRFIPFAIDTDKYTPLFHREDDLEYMDLPENDELTILMPSRQFWPLKGNDKFILGFQQFIQENPDVKAKVIVIDYGVDIFREKLKQMVKALDLERYIQYIPPMPKDALIELTRKVDIVADQFTQGSSGTAGYEALSMGKPTMIYIDHWTADCFGDGYPPFVNCRDPDQIAYALGDLLSNDKRLIISTNSRNWSLSHTSYEVVSKKFINLYKEVYYDAS